MQGRMEFGPRALGNRSILADPRRGEMQTTVNQKIKFRESFRPFAPSVLAEQVAEYFEVPQDTISPYMLLVFGLQHCRRLRPDRNAVGLQRVHQRRSDLPAITHVDYSARVQTVDDDHHPALTGLLRSFYRRTGCPVLINTSFNVRGEPLVCTPEDAFRCFLATDIDVLVIENYVLCKEQQQEPKPDETDKHLARFELD
jgi:carbamoyltransferase